MQLPGAEAAMLLAELVSWTNCQVSVHAPEHAQTASCGELNGHASIYAVVIC